MPPHMYRTVGILTGSQFINNLGFGFVIPVLPMFVTEMGMGPSGVGLILSMSAVGRLATNIPFARLSDKVGRKPLMVAGQLVTAAASFGTAVVTTLPALLGYRLMLGMGSSCAMAGSGAYMADTTSKVPWHRAKILGFQSTVINLAYTIGPACGGFLADLYGARASFVIVGTAAAAASAGFSLLPETLKKGAALGRTAEGGGGGGGGEGKGRSPGDAGGAGGTGGEGGEAAAAAPPAVPAEAAQASQASFVEVYGPLLRNPDQQGVMAVTFSIFGSYAALMTLMPLHAMAILGESGTMAQVGTLFAASSVIGFFGAPLGGYLADKVGRKATIIPAAALICAGVLSTTAGFVDSFDSLLCTVVLWGAGNSLVNPGLSAYTADIAKDEATRGQALSLSRQAGDAALLVAPAGLGLLAQVTSVPTALCATAAAVAAANAVFAVRATDHHQGAFARAMARRGR